MQRNKQDLLQKIYNYRKLIKIQKYAHYTIKYTRNVIEYSADRLMSYMMVDIDCEQIHSASRVMLIVACK